MVDVRGDVLRPPHGTTPAAVKSNIKSEMRSFKSNENIHKKEGGSIRCGLVVRIPGFHPGGPGSIPGIGKRIFF